MSFERHNAERQGQLENVYELNDVEHDLVSKYHPTFLAKGGEHIIYELPEHPHVVVKVRVDTLKKVMEWNIEHDAPVTSLSPEIASRAHQYLEREQKRYRQLQKYFGSDHVPGQEEFLMKVPVTESLLRELYEGNPPALTGEAWSVVMIQKRVEALRDAERLALVAGYAEHGDVPEDVYDRVTKDLVFHEETEHLVESNEFHQVQSHEDLQRLVTRADTDSDLRDVLKEVVARMIAYTEETGEILDLAGDDNLIIHRKDDAWTFTLVDALYPGEDKMMEKARDALRTVSDGGEMDEEYRNILLNALNYVRTVNGLAKQAGVEERIHLLPEGVGMEESHLLNLLR